MPGVPEESSTHIAYRCNKKLPQAITRVEYLFGYFSPVAEWFILWSQLFASWFSESYTGHCIKSIKQNFDIIRKPYFFMIGPVKYLRQLFWLCQKVHLWRSLQELDSFQQWKRVRAPRQTGTVKCKWSWIAECHSNRFRRHLQFWETHEWEKEMKTVAYASFCAQREWDDRYISKKLFAVNPATTTARRNGNHSYSVQLHFVLSLWRCCSHRSSWTALAWTISFLYFPLIFHLIFQFFPFL